MNIPRKIIVSPENAQYVGFAEVYLDKIERYRQSAKIPVIKKSFAFKDVYIILTTSSFVQRIIIIGGIAYPYILFATTDQNTAWNFFKDKFVKAGDEYNGTLSPVYNGLCQFEDGNNQYLKKWSSTDFEATGGTSYFGGVALYELACYASQNAVYGLTSSSQWFTMLSGQTSLLPSLCFTDTISANITLMPEGDFEWCQLENTIVYKKYFSSAAIHEGFIWYPSFFYAEEENGVRTVGWFYGSADFSWAEGDGYTNLEIVDGIAGRAELLGFIEARSPNLRKYGFGYCEMVTELNLQTESIELPILSFFISGEDTGAEITQTTFNYSSESTPGSAVRVEVITPYSALIPIPITTGYMEYFSWKSFGDESRAQMRGGTIPQGNPSRLFALYNPFHNSSGPDRVDMWAFEAWYQPLEDDSLALITPTPDCIGIALIQNKTAIFYRYKGILQQVYRTDNYHSHSTSPGGQILAVFEGEDIITNTIVFDLFGVKIKADKANIVSGFSLSDYSSGGFTVLNTKDVSDYVSSQAVVIPHRVKGFNPHAPIIGGETTIVPNKGAYYPAMGALRWARDGNGGLLINKMVIADGTKAHVGQSSQGCDFSIIIDDPRSPADTDHFVMQWNQGLEEWPADVSGLDTILGYVRGEFVGDHPSMTFHGEGNPAIKEVKLPEHFVFVSAVGEPFWYAEDYVGPLEVTATPFEDCEIGTKTVFTAIDACGREETIEATRNPPEDLTIYNELEITVFYVGMTFLTSGGAGGPYTFTFSGGEITNGGVITSLNSCSEGEGAVVTVTDFCGNQASYDGTMPVVETSISGTETPVVGSVYSGSGEGEGTFSISSGSIDSETGEILSEGCGSGTVTYTDDCGSASMEIRWSTGVWTEISETNYNLPVISIAGSCATPCCWLNGCAAPYQQYGASIEEGKMKYTYIWSCCREQGPESAGCTQGTPGLAEHTLYCEGISGILDSYKHAFLRKLTVYEWICS